MAIAAATVWEVRGVTGVDTNGGGFVAGSTGTDYSQQDAKNTVGNNISTTDAVANNSTTLTSATATFTAAIVGNIIYLAGGNGSLVPGWYQVVTYTNVTTVVLDRAVATGTGITMNIGGALATLNVASYAAIASNKVFVKADGTYTIPIPTVVADIVANGTTTITSASNPWTAADVGKRIMLRNGSGNLIPTVRTLTTYSNAGTFVLDTLVASGTSVVMHMGSAIFLGVAAAPTTPPTTIEGYTTTRGDAGRASLALQTTAAQTCLMSTLGTFFKNFIIDCASLTTSSGIYLNAGCSENCKISNFTQQGVYIGAAGTISNCEITGGTSAASGGVVIASAVAGVGISRCYIHGNACTGINSGANGICVVRCIIANNSGATSDGIAHTPTSAVADIFLNNVFYNNGRDGFRLAATRSGFRMISNNIFSSNAGSGIYYSTSAGSAAQFNLDGNAYYGNGATRTNCDDTTTNKQNSVAPYTNIYDVILAGSPFVDAAHDDFRLNQNTNGAACRSTGVPRTFNGLTGNRNFIDIGAVGHQDQGFAG